MRTRLALPLALFLGGCAGPPQVPVRAAVPSLVTDITAWAAYDHDGETYVHLWSPGTPKSVYVANAADLPPSFLDELERQLPQQVGVPVQMALTEGLRENPTWIRSLWMASASGAPASGMPGRAAQQDRAAPAR